MRHIKSIEFQVWKAAEKFLTRPRSSHIDLSFSPVKRIFLRPCALANGVPAKPIGYNPRMDAAAQSIPAFFDVVAAAARLDNVAITTPFILSPLLSQQLGARVFLKLETLQCTGSFKFRGAYNRLVQLSPVERRRGVVAFSSGNHAQGVAAAARLLDMPATIVMPKDAPRIKLENTRALGAEVVFYDRKRDRREEIAARIAGEKGAIVVPAFDDAAVVAGQGSAGLEIAAQAAALGVTLDAVLVPCSGGGLTSGIALALSETSPI